MKYHWQKKQKNFDGDTIYFTCLYVWGGIVTTIAVAGAVYDLLQVIA